PMMTTLATFRQVCSVLALALAACGLAGAQTVTGTITGTVVDPSGAAVPGAAVHLENEETKQARDTKSNEIGEFVFTAVPPGPYTPSMEAKGFQTARRTGVVLSADRRVPLGAISLTVGDVNQTVTVAALGEHVSTEDADVTGRLTTRQMDQQIIKGRDPLSL